MSHSDSSESAKSGSKRGSSWSPEPSPFDIKHESSMRHLREPSVSRESSTKSAWETQLASIKPTPATYSRTSPSIGYAKMLFEPEIAQAVAQAAYMRGHSDDLDDGGYKTEYPPTHASYAPSSPSYNVFTREERELKQKFKAAKLGELPDLNGMLYCEKFIVSVAQEAIEKDHEKILDLKREIAGLEANKAVKTHALEAFLKFVEQHRH